MKRSFPALFVFLCLCGGCKTTPPPAPPAAQTIEVRTLPARTFAVRPLPPDPQAAVEALRQAREEATRRGWPVVDLFVIYPSGAEAYLALAIGGPVEVEAPWRVETAPPLRVAVRRVQADPIAASLEIRAFRREAAEAGLVATGYVLARPAGDGTELMLPLEDS